MKKLLLGMLILSLCSCAEHAIDDKGKEMPFSLYEIRKGKCTYIIAQSQPFSHISIIHSGNCEYCETKKVK